MPAYDYDCADCGTRFEVVHGVHADPPTICPACGSDKIRKAISAPAVHYKGSGWAKKERRTTASPSTSRSATDGASGGGGSGDGGSGDGASGDGASGDGGSGADTKASDEPSKPAKSSKTETATAGTTD
jgi:putative FmdB family regulatory protein